MHCVNGDQAFLWEMAKFDHSQNQNRSTGWYEIVNIWLRAMRETRLHINFCKKQFSGGFCRECWNTCGVESTEGGGASVESGEIHAGYKAQRAASVSEWVSEQLLDNRCIVCLTADKMSCYNGSLMYVHLNDLIDSSWRGRSDDVFSTQLQLRWWWRRWV